MKKIISSLLICVLLLGSVLVLGSCGKKINKGTYVSSDGIVVEISGKDFVIKNGDVSEEYTYEIKKDSDDPDRQKIYLTNDDGETVDFYYTKHDDGFEFAGKKYTKK
jgi:hypothetical protein